MRDLEFLESREKIPPKKTKKDGHSYLQETSYRLNLQVYLRENSYHENITSSPRAAREAKSSPKGCCHILGAKAPPVSMASAFEITRFRSDPEEFQTT